MKLEKLSKFKGNTVEELTGAAAGAAIDRMMEEIPQMRAWNWVTRYAPQSQTPSPPPLPLQIFNVPRCASVLLLLHPLCRLFVGVRLDRRLVVWHVCSAAVA